MLDLTIARLRNRWTRIRLRNRKLDSAARSNLKALDHLNPLRSAKFYRYVVVDVETTGLNLRHDRILRIAAVRIRDCRIQVGLVFNELVNPGREIPCGAIKLHGIFPRLVAKARTEEEVFSDFLDFLGDDILVAHHAGFEFIDSHHELETNTKMRAEMERMGGRVYKRYRVFQKKL